MPFYSGGVPCSSHSFSPESSIKEIADEISRSLDFLETETRNVPERHRSIRAVFETSWERLSEAEQNVFIRLSVFRDGFTRDAAQRVTGAGLRQLIALVNKSLLWRDPDSGRFDIDNLLRQYADGRLEASGQADEARDTHCVYYADFLHRSEASLKGSKQLATLDKIEVDFENVRAAWQWAVERRHYDAIARLSKSLDKFCFIRNRFERARRSSGQHWTLCRKKMQRVVRGS